MNLNIEVDAYRNGLQRMFFGHWGPWCKSHPGLRAFMW